MARSAYGERYLKTGGFGTKSADEHMSAMRQITQEAHAGDTDLAAALGIKLAAAPASSPPPAPKPSPIPQAAPQTASLPKPTVSAVPTATPNPALEGLKSGFKALQVGPKPEAQATQSTSEGAAVPAEALLQPSPGFVEGTHGQLRALGQRRPPALTTVLAGLRSIY